MNMTHKGDETEPLSLIALVRTSRRSRNFKRNGLSIFNVINFFLSCRYFYLDKQHYLDKRHAHGGCRRQRGTQSRIITESCDRLTTQLTTEKSLISSCHTETSIATVHISGFSRSYRKRKCHLCFEAVAWRTWLLLFPIAFSHCCQ